MSAAMKYGFELKTFPDSKKFNYIEEFKIGGKTRKEIGEFLIAIGVLIKDELPERDDKGRFVARGTKPGKEGILTK